MDKLPKSVSLFCTMAQSPPLLHAHQTRHQPPTTTVKLSLLRPTTKQSPPWCHHPPWYHLLPPRHQSLPIVPLPRAPKVVLPVLALSPAPISLACPPPPSEHLWAGCPTLGPCRMPDFGHARNASSPQLSFTMALVLTTARAA